MLLAGPSQHSVVNPTENETEYGCFMIQHILLSHYFIVPSGTRTFYCPLQFTLFVTSYLRYTILLQNYDE